MPLNSLRGAPALVVMQHRGRRGLNRTETELGKAGGPAPPRRSTIAALRAAPTRQAAARAPPPVSIWIATSSGRPDGPRVRGRVAHREPDRPRDYSAGDDKEPAGDILHRRLGQWPLDGGAQGDGRKLPSRTGNAFGVTKPCGTSSVRTPA
jgi:hypothetical protein